MADRNGPEESPRDSRAAERNHLLNMEEREDRMVREWKDGGNIFDVSFV